jgi:hypothetical protein
MIQFSTTVRNILSQPTIEAFYLVEVYVSSGTTYRSTTYYRNVVITNNSVISFADPTFTFGASVDSGLIGKLVDVKVGFVNQTTKLPELDIANLLTVYRGKIDSTEYSINTSVTGEVLLNVSCSSPMNDLDLTKSFYTTKDATLGRDSSDTSFDQIYEGSGVLQLKWGKK